MESILKKIENNSDKELYRRVDEVLHYVWDPIGVSDIPEARDEYYGYLPQIYSMVKSNCSINSIAVELRKIIIEQIGLTSTIEQSTEVAELLVHWKKVITEKDNN